MRLLGVQRLDQLGMQHVSVMFAFMLGYAESVFDIRASADQYPFVRAAGVRWPL